MFEYWSTERLFVVLLSVFFQSMCMEEKIISLGWLAV
jgi:hypothetical protein